MRALKASLATPWGEMWKGEEFCPIVAVGLANYETGLTSGAFLYLPAEL